MARVCARACVHAHAHVSQSCAPGVRLACAWRRVARRSRAGAHALNRGRAQRRCAAIACSFEERAQVDVGIARKERRIAQPKALGVLVGRLREHVADLQPDHIQRGILGGKVEAEDSSRTSNVHVHWQLGIAEARYHPTRRQLKPLHVHRLERIDVVADLFLVAHGPAAHVIAQALSRLRPSRRRLLG